MSPWKRNVAEMLESSELEALIEHMLQALRQTGLGVRRLQVVPGRADLRSGTYPNESMVCELEDGSRVPLFLKYSRARRPASDRHRGGIAYEAEVYQRFLEPFSGSTARLMAAGEIAPMGISFLLIEELEGIQRISKTPESPVRAADWIGRFHAANEGSPDPRHPTFLTVYDRDYYEQWSRRAFDLTRPLQPEYSMLAQICAAFERTMIPVLLASPPTVIHGEFYPLNILTRDATIYPVDWESAAVAPGEIDLAALTEGWAPDIAEECSRAYVEARWPGGAPHGFEEALAASRFYFLFRWLGNGPYFATGKRGRQRLDALHALAEQTGLLGPRALRS